MCRFSAYVTLSALLGCGTTAARQEVAPVERAHTAPTPAPAPAPLLERLTLLEHGRDATHAEVGLDSLYCGDAVNPGRADLHVGEAYFTLMLPGCAQGGGFGWGVERADPGPTPWARFVRSPVVAAIDGRDQQPHELAITGAIVGFGQRVTPRTMHMRPGNTFAFAFTTSHAEVAEGAPQPHERLLTPDQEVEEKLGNQVLVLALGAQSLLGCPTVRLTLLDPRSQLVDVRDGETGTVRTDARLRLGDVTLRWEGLGEARMIGGDRAMLSFTGSVGDGAEEPFHCIGSAPCTFHGVLIELVEFGVKSTFRLRRMPDAPAP